MGTAMTTGGKANVQIDHKADLSAGLLEPVASPFDSLKTWRHCNILRNTNGRKTAISSATKTGTFTLAPGYGNYW